MEIMLNTEEKMKKAIESMKLRFTSVRAGRANPKILDRVMVNSYGALTPLNQVAIISVPEARQLMIKPYDKTIMQEIEKGIYEANIGLTPNNNGEVIYLNIPVLTEQTRKEYVKDVKSMSEDCKINIRTIRQDANNEIKKEELSEDEEKSLMSIIQELTNKYNDLTEKELKNKEEELMTV